MEKELRNLIIGDYKKALEHLPQIVSGKKMNCWVRKPNQYLSPTITIQDVPLNDEDWEFAYYNSICETLEKLLAGEKAEYTCRLRDAPKEIKELLEPIKVDWINLKNPRYFFQLWNHSQKQNHFY